MRLLKQGLLHVALPQQPRERTSSALEPQESLEQGTNTREPAPRVGPMSHRSDVPCKQGWPSFQWCISGCRWILQPGWILQPLKSLSMFTQTAKWLQQLVMLTRSRCLHGIMKIFRPSERVTARVLPRVTAGPAGTHPAARAHGARDSNSRSGRRSCGSSVPLQV